MRTTTLFLGVLLAGTLPLTAARAGNLVGTRKGRRHPVCSLDVYTGCLDAPVEGAPVSVAAPPAATRLAGNTTRGLDTSFAVGFHASQEPAGFSMAPDSGMAQGSEPEKYADFSPGQSTAFGQHAVEWTLLAAPLAAYALSPALDRRLHYQDNGIWQRKRQLDFEYAVIAGEVGGSLWFGGQSRIGKTFWRSMDASFYTAITVQAMKYAFSRARPSQSSSPDHWFQGNCCQSFPSGEVSFQASAVTPFIAEYHKQYPWVWALEALPAYDALARMKAHGHWQTDVLAAWAIGTAWGLYAHYEPKPLILSIMPHGILVGIHVKF